MRNEPSSLMKVCESSGAPKPPARGAGGTAWLEVPDG